MELKMLGDLPEAELEGRGSGDKGGVVDGLVAENIDGASGE
jgi:hypothetical protein